MSSCFVIPSDFDSNKFSLAIQELLNEAPTAPGKPEGNVDYSTPPVFSDPMPIAGIDLAVKNSEVPEPYFVTFSTKSSRIHQDYQDQMNTIHSIWDKLIIEKQKPEPYHQLDLQRPGELIEEFDQSTYQPTQYYIPDQDEIQEEEEDFSDSQEPFDFTVSTVNNISRPFMQSLMMSQSQATTDSKAMPREIDGNIYQMSFSRSTIRKDMPS